MFCPNCKAEFREGITRCTEYNVDLVNELPPVPKPIFVYLEEVIINSDAAQIGFIKSILEGEKIPYYAQGDHSYTHLALIPVRFLVPKNKYKKAKELLKDL
ncbi:MAG: DUF2007 domain-containing protein [Candidatus Aminicenantes bacterium]|nr:DUF2007 domain-containing protein [Candidatus Aminicenantes bacterium]